MLHSREHLSGVLVNVVQLPGDVGTQVLHGLVDVDLLVDARCLVLVLPGLHIHDGETSLEGSLEILKIFRKKNIFFKTFN